MLRYLRDVRNGGMVQVSDPDRDALSSQVQAAERQQSRLRRELRRESDQNFAAFQEQSQRADRLLDAAKSWKAYGEFYKAALAEVVEMARTEHAENVANRKAIDRMWQESANAPRPEERPFSSNMEAVNGYRAEVYKETLLSDTAISDRVERIKENLKKQYKW